MWVLGLREVTAQLSSHLTAGKALRESLTGMMNQITWVTSFKKTTTHHSKDRTPHSETLLASINGSKETDWENAHSGLCEHGGTSKIPVPVSLHPGMDTLCIYDFPWIQCRDKWRPTMWEKKRLFILSSL